MKRRPERPNPQNIIEVKKQYQSKGGGCTLTVIEIKIGVDPKTLESMVWIHYESNSPFSVTQFTNLVTLPHFLELVELMPSLGVIETPKEKIS